MASEENKYLKACNDKLKDDKLPEKKKRFSSQVRFEMLDFLKWIPRDTALSSLNTLSSGSMHAH